MPTQDEKNTSDLSEQAVALAEQLGRIAGTIEGTAGTWMNRQKVADQLTRVRDQATQMLEGLAGSVAKGRKASKAASAKAPAPRARQADPAHAPGKRRKKPAPTLRGVKKSDERIPKMRTAAAARQRRKSYA